MRGVPFELPATIFSPGPASKSPGPFHPPQPPNPYRGYPPHPSSHSHHPHPYKPVNGMLGLNPHPLAGGFQVQSKLE